MRTGGTGDEAALRQICIRAGLPAAAALGVVALAFLIPALYPADLPNVDLTTAFSQFVFWITQTGGKIGITIVAVLMLVFFAAGLNPRWRRRETAIVFMIALICGGGGSILNEYFLKELLQVPRPNVVWLSGENGTGPLGMTPQELYQGGDRETRSRVLETALNREPKTIRLSPLIKAHWIHETGYSLPSGHAFSTMFFAVFFLFLAVTYVSVKRRVLFYASLPWAVAVSYSRLILRVHSPADITIGSGIGLTIGVCAWAAARFLIRRYAWADAR